MTKEFIFHLQEKTDTIIIKTPPLSGGCINETKKIETSTGDYFIKTNTKKKQTLGTNYLFLNVHLNRILYFKKQTIFKYMCIYIYNIMSLKSYRKNEGCNKHALNIV